MPIRRSTSPTAKAIAPVVMISCDQSAMATAPMPKIRKALSVASEAESAVDSRIWL